MLEVIDSDPTRLRFKMTSSVSREIDFDWACIKETIRCKWKDKKVLAFIDSKVYESSEEWAKLELEHRSLMLVPTNLSESTKQVNSLLACLERIETAGFSRRDDVLLAIGGGVLMDLVSLAANLYRRGVAVVKVPTTLVGFVDASVGIKTGVNYLGQRNRLGSYYLNYDVIYDTELLKTMDEELVREGLGEIFKIAIIKSKKLFELLEQSLDDLKEPGFYQSSAGTEIIGLSVKLMLEELHDNPTETNLMRCVDFGHSFSPLIEMQSLELEHVDAIPHGLAVGADCIITSIISFNRGLLDSKSLARIMAVGEVVDFIHGHELYERDDLMWSSLLDMTVHKSGDQNLPIPTEIGNYSFIQDLSFDEMSRATRRFREGIKG
jgi:3-dehydroquinate synthetase